jgi:hypothetical protein
MAAGSGQPLATKELYNALELRGKLANELGQIPMNANTKVKQAKMNEWRAANEAAFNAALRAGFNGAHKIAHGQGNIKSFINAFSSKGTQVVKENNKRVKNLEKLQIAATIHAVRTGSATQNLSSAKNAWNTARAAYGVSQTPNTAANVINKAVAYRTLYKLVHGNTANLPNGLVNSIQKAKNEVGAKVKAANNAAKEARENAARAKANAEVAAQAAANAAGTATSQMATIQAQLAASAATVLEKEAALANKTALLAAAAAAGANKNAELAAMRAAANAAANARQQAATAAAQALQAAVTAKNAAEADKAAALAAGNAAAAAQAQAQADAAAAQAQAAAAQEAATTAAATAAAAEARAAAAEAQGMTNKAARNEANRLKREATARANAAEAARNTAHTKIALIEGQKASKVATRTSNLEEKLRIWIKNPGNRNINKAVALKAAAAKVLKSGGSQAATNAQQLANIYISLHKNAAKARVTSAQNAFNAAQNSANNIKKQLARRNAAIKFIAAANALPGVANSTKLNAARSYVAGTNNLAKNIESRLINTLAIAADKTKAAEAALARATTAEAAKAAANNLKNAALAEAANARQVAANARAAETAARNAMAAAKTNANRLIAEAELKQKAAEANAATKAAAAAAAAVAQANAEKRAGESNSAAAEAIEAKRLANAARISAEQAAAAAASNRAANVQAAKQAYENAQANFATGPNSNKAKKLRNAAIAYKALNKSANINQSLRNANARLLANFQAAEKIRANKVAKAEEKARAAEARAGNSAAAAAAAEAARANAEAARANANRERLNAVALAEAAGRNAATARAAAVNNAAKAANALRQKGNVEAAAAAAAALSKAAEEEKAAALEAAAAAQALAAAAQAEAAAARSERNAAAAQAANSNAQVAAASASLAAAEKAAAEAAAEAAKQLAAAAEAVAAKQANANQKIADATAARNAATAAAANATARANALGAAKKKQVTNAKAVYNAAVANFPNGSSNINKANAALNAAIAYRAILGANNANVTAVKNRAINVLKRSGAGAGAAAERWRGAARGAALARQAALANSNSNSNNNSDNERNVNNLLPINSKRRARRAQLYRFPRSGTLEQRVGRVSDMAWTYFKALEARNANQRLTPLEAASAILRRAMGAPFVNAGGVENNSKRATSKAYMDRFDWQQLLEAEGLVLTPAQNATIRTILLMLQIDPHSNNRGTATRSTLFNRYKLTYSNNAVPVSIKNMINSQKTTNKVFLNKLNRLQGLNKGPGLFRSIGGAALGGVGAVVGGTVGAVKGVGRGVAWVSMGAAERTGLTKLMNKLKPIVTQELKAVAQNAFQTLIAPRPNGKPPNFGAVWGRFLQRMTKQSKQLAVNMTADFAKSLVGNNEQLKALVDVAMPALVERAKLRVEEAIKASGQARSAQEVEQIVAAEVAVETKNVVKAAKAKLGILNANANAEILAKAQKVRQRVHTNIGIAGNDPQSPYGTRNSRANKARNAAVTYYKAALKNGKSLNSQEVKNDIKNIISFAVQPRSNRPPRMSNMAWASVGALAVGGAALGAIVGIQALLAQIQAFKASQAALKQAKQAWNSAVELAKQKQGEALLKKRAIGSVENAAQKAAARVASNRASQVAREAVNKAAQLKAAVNKANKALKTTQSGATKMATNKLRQALEHVAKNGTVTSNIANKFTRIFGSDPRVTTALQNPAMARTLLQNLASLSIA